MGTGGKDYVPANDAEFCEWGEVLVFYAAKNYERWGVIPLPEDMAGRISKFKQLVDICAKPTRSKMDTLAKNNFRKPLEKDLRNYVQGVVVRNTNVTDEDRATMRLNIRDSKQSPAGKPVGQAEADIAFPGRTQLMLHIRHVAGTPSDARANYGCRIHYNVYAPGSPAPTEEEELRESRFSRQKKVLFSFRSSDTGKTVYFSIRYENSRGEAGAWGPMFSAVIP